MASLQFSSSGPPASEEELVNAERELGIQIPVEYRGFLAQRNGAEPDALYAIPGSDEDPGLTGFLGVGAYDDRALVRTRLDYRDRVPGSMLPIAEAEGGNLVCIAMDGPQAGVYVWKHEEEAEEGEPPTSDNLYLLANSFGEYLAALREVEDEDLGERATEGWVDPKLLEELRGH